MPEPNTTKPGESSEDILAKSVAALRKDEATDISLLEIIANHIATLSPATDAVDVAVKDIEALAVERGDKVG